MIKFITALLPAIIFTTSGWTSEAELQSKHESVGIGSGAVIGGVVAGPVGFVFGAAMGAFLGDLFDAEHDSRTQLEKQWAEARAEVEILNSLVENSGRAVVLLEEELRNQDKRMQSSVSEALDVKVLFRTNESELPDVTETRLLRLAELLGRFDDTLIQIEAHTDARGKLSDNKQLAEQRATAVMETLIKGGVPFSRIIMNAYGEAYASAVESDVDSMAMERRVDLTLIRNEQTNRVAQQ